MIITTTTLPTLKIHKLTTAQYEAALAAGTLDPTAIYLTPSDADKGLVPEVTTANNGQFLRVVNGAWAAVTVPSAEGVTFGE